MSKLISYPLALLLLLTSHVALGKAELVSSQLDRSTLVLKLTVRNPDATARRIVRVGLNRTVSGGDKCIHIGNEPRLRSLADHRVEFYLMGHPQSFVRIDPGILIPPAETVSFTIAISPDTGGLCGNWSFEVNGFVLLDDGTQLETAKTVINSDEFKAALNRRPAQAEVFALLKDRDHLLRMKGIEQLNDKDFDTTTLERSLAALLENDQPNVRTATYKKIASLKLLGLEPALRTKLQRLPRPLTKEGRYVFSVDAIGLADALASMKSMASTDQILDLLEDPDFNLVILIKGPLKELESPQTLAKVIARLNKNRDWASIQQKYGPDYGDGEANRYFVLLSALISYRDPSTLPLLKSIMDDPVNRPAARSIINLFINLSERPPQTDDAFKRDFLQYAEKFLHDDGKDDKVNVRGAATILFVRTTSDPNKKVALLRTALKDSSAGVRLSAAREVGALKLKELAPELKSAHQSASDKLKDSFCEALKQLGETCQFLTLPRDTPQVTWQEEVMLGSKETLVVERTVMRQSMQIGWEKNSIPSQHIIRFQDPTSSTQPIEWRSSKVGGPAGIYPEFPLGLDKARDGTWFIYTRFSLTGAACFQDSKYQLKEGKWSEVDLPLNIETYKPNLYLGADRNMSVARVTLAQKAEEKPKPNDSDFYDQVGPKKFRCASHYSGPYPPVNRPFR